MDRRIVFCSAVAALLLASCLGGGSEMFDSPAAIPGDCAVEGNLIRNCGFDYDSFGWVCNASSTRHLTSDCRSGSGCVELTRDAPSSSPIVSVSQCVAVAPDGVYSYAAHVQVVAGVADYCELGVHAYLARDCSGLPYTDSLVYQMFQPGTSWDQSPALSVDTSLSVGQADPGPRSVRIACSCRGSSTLVVRFDDFFLGSTLPQ